jgi:hypothetical protein
MNHSRRLATDENLREFELFFRRHYEHLTQYVSRRTPFSQVDDLVSTTFIIAWKKFHQTKNPTLPWLLQIAKYEIANKRRSERTRQNNVTLINVEEFPETRFSGDFDGTEVVNALSRLSLQRVLPCPFIDSPSEFVNDLAGMLQLPCGKTPPRAFEPEEERCSTLEELVEGRPQHSPAPVVLLSVCLAGRWGIELSNTVFLARYA